MTNIMSRQPRPRTVKHRLPLQYNTAQKIIMVCSAIVGTVSGAAFLSLLLLPMPDTLLRAIMVYLSLVLTVVAVFNFLYAKWNDDEL